MFRAGRIEFSEVGRPFWALVALTVLLLAWVSIGLAQTATPEGLVDGLRRDLAAIRLQLESVEPTPATAGQRTAAFNADLGDGGPAYRHASLVTIGRAAGRRMERLMAALEDAGDQRRATRAAGLRLELVDLRRRIDQLGVAGDGADARARIDEVVRMIVELDQELTSLFGDLPPA